MKKSHPLQDFVSERFLGNGAMSHRRVSVKDLGQCDCQGWLYKRKESRGLLGWKWKKCWFVLKKCSLYWYISETAEMAEGYISMRDVVVNQATECKKKFAMKASHLQLVTLYFAAENLKDMNKWLFKLTQASNEVDPTDLTSGDCYSEKSDDDDDDEEEEAEMYIDYMHQFTPGSRHGNLPPPRSSSSPCLGIPLVSPVCNRAESSSTDSESWQELSSEEDPILRIQEFKDNRSSVSDEMEMLYLHLKKASLSPTGAQQPSTIRDFRSSFVIRCKDKSVNNKLHLIRTLNSTLKAKEADLQALNQVLNEPSLSASKYRRWRDANVLMLQEVRQKHDTDHQPLLQIQPQPESEISLNTGLQAAHVYTETRL